MPDVSKSMTVPASGTVTIPFGHTKSGIQWVVSQLANSTSPFRVGSVLTVQRNGQYITSTPLASGDAATGPPFLLLNASDVLNFIFTGMTSGDQCVGTIFYTEQVWSANPQGGYVV
jgi:hypothetical protein